MKIAMRAVAGLIAGAVALTASIDHKSGWRAVGGAEAQTYLQNMMTKLRGERLPAGIAKSNGRLEATQVDVSSKYAGRLAEVDVEEGSTVSQGQKVAIINSPEIEAQLRAAEAEVQKAKDTQAAAEADITTRESQLEFAKTDYERGAELVKSGTISKQTYDQRKRNFDSAASAVVSSKAQRDQAASAIKSASAQVDRLKSMIADLTLVSPRNGRVQYQLARAGEVVGAGTPILTVLDLTDVYMTLFLPAGDAGKLEVGSEARLILDPIPQFVVPAKVSFVAADAQFTPKTVETKDERTKLMFRVKLKIDQDVLLKFYKRVKTGVRGVGFVKFDNSLAWPADLQVKLPAQ
jgi:HlyD family secretion protein